VTILSVSEAACMAGVELSAINSQIASGVLNRTAEGIDVSELIIVYPDLKPLAGLKLRSVKQPPFRQTQVKQTQVEQTQVEQTQVEQTQVKQPQVKQPQVKQPKDKQPAEEDTTLALSAGGTPTQASVMIADVTELAVSRQGKSQEQSHAEATGDSNTDSSTVSLLIRELEWNKELLEQTNQLMAKQLADQRSLIADQARRLDEKDRFWARQVEIAQSLLAAPAPRKKFLGLF